MTSTYHAATYSGNLSQIAHEPEAVQQAALQRPNSILRTASPAQGRGVQNPTIVDSSLRQAPRGRLVSIQDQIEVIQIPLEGGASKTVRPHRALVDREKISIPKQAAQEALRWQLRAAQQEIRDLRAQIALREQAGC